MDYQITGRLLGGVHTEFSALVDEAQNMFVWDKSSQFKLWLQLAFASKFRAQWRGQDTEGSVVMFSTGNIQCRAPQFIIDIVPEVGRASSLSEPFERLQTQETSVDSRTQETPEVRSTYEELD